MKTLIEPLTPYRLPDVPPLSPNPSINTPTTVSLPFVTVRETLKWEYKCILHDLAQSKMLSEEELNHLGSEGWELASAFRDSSSIYFYFKRPGR